MIGVHRKLSVCLLMCLIGVALQARANSADQKRYLDAEISTIIREARLPYVAMDKGEPIVRSMLGLKPNHLCDDPSMGHYDEAKKDFYEIGKVVESRKAAAVARLGRTLTPREQALAVLRMPKKTPDSVLKNRCAFIDWTLNMLMTTESRRDEVTFFDWFEHSPRVEFSAV